MTNKFRILDASKLVVLYEAIDQILEMVRLVGHVAHKAEKT
jgi:hypothetical protein